MKTRIIYIFLLSSLLIVGCIVSDQLYLNQLYRQLSLIPLGLDQEVMIQSSISLRNTSLEMGELLCKHFPMERYAFFHNQQKIVIFIVFLMLLLWVYVSDRKQRGEKEKVVQEMQRMREELDLILHHQKVNHGDLLAFQNELEYQFKKKEEQRLEMVDLYENLFHQLKAELSVQVIQGKKISCLGQIDEILQLSRFKTNRMKMNFIQVDLFEMLETLCYDYHSYALQKGIEIHIEGSHILIEVDEFWIYHAFETLVKNAVDYSPANIIVYLYLKQDEKIVRIFFTNKTKKDCDIENVFKRYESLNGSHGIGLAMCKAIVESHFGKIEAYVDGEEMTIEIQLPKINLK